MWAITLFFHVLEISWEVEVVDGVDWKNMRYYAESLHGYVDSNLLLVDALL